MALYIYIVKHMMIRNENHSPQGDKVLDKVSDKGVQDPPYVSILLPHPIVAEPLKQDMQADKHVLI